MSELNISEFSRKLFTLMPAIMRGFLEHQTDEVAKGTISMPQYLVLHQVFSNGEQKMTALAREMSVSLPAMTGLVTRLHKLGMVKRTSGIEDRRIIHIGLTTKGKNVIKKVRQQREKRISKVFGKLEPREREEYLRILIKIHNILHKSSKQCPEKC